MSESVNQTLAPSVAQLKKKKRKNKRKSKPVITQAQNITQTQSTTQAQSTTPTPAQSATPTPAQSTTQSQSITPTPAQQSTTPPPVQNSVKPLSLTEKLHNRLGVMKSRRTGVERRKREEELKAQGEKPKNSNAMRSIARGEISELLGKMGINDPKIESEVMNEIVRGNLRTPTAIAEYLVQKLQLAYPRGAPKPTKQQTPPTEILSTNQVSDQTTTPSEPEKTVHGHKPLKHPSPSLVLKKD